MPAGDQGVDLPRYMLVPRTLTFLTHDEKVLLLRGAQDKRLWAGLYNGVGGHVEIGEDVLSAARRELLEEAGLAPTRLWLCATVTVDTGANPGVCLFIFKGECAREEAIPSAEGSLEWLSASEIYRLPLVEDLQQLLPKILSMSYGEAPFSAHSSYNESGKLVVSFA